MIDSAMPLEGVRKTIRKFLLLKDDDPIDLVMLAGILANFAPDRDVPVWLVIVGDPASGKTELTSLIQDWRYTWVLPDVLTEAYFFSSKSGTHSALTRLQEGDYRLIYSQDMGGMMDTNRLYGPPIFQQLRGIHDGFLKKETGFDSRPLLYGQEHKVEGVSEPVYTPVPPEKRLGWLGTSTPEFYPWAQRHARLGSRFTCYYFNPLTNWLDYQSLSKIDTMRAEKAHWRPAARTAVQNFLDLVISRFEGFEALRASDAQSDRISAAVKLVNRVIGSRTVTDTGARLQPRILSMCRVMAFMAGKPAITDEELQIGLRIVMSQLPADEHKILRFALGHSGNGFWPVRELLLDTGMGRRQVEHPLERMVDVGVLEQKGGKGVFGFSYTASPKTRKLAGVFSGK
jgi:hypothetical protein